MALICVEPNSSYFRDCFSLQSITRQSSAFSLPLDCRDCLRAPTFPRRCTRVGGISNLLQQGRRLMARRIDMMWPSRTAKPCKLLIARWLWGGTLY